MLVKILAGSINRFACELHDLKPKRDKLRLLVVGQAEQFVLEQCIGHNEAEGQFENCPQQITLFKSMKQEVSLTMIRIDYAWPLHFLFDHRKR